MREPNPSTQAPAAAVVGTTLREHVLTGMSASPGATGEFTSLLNHLSLAIRIINSRVRAAGLAGLLGYTGETNVQGEEVQKLDAFSNEVLVNVLARSGHCGVIASEELDDAILHPDRGKYVVCFDPLDGSGNIDTNVGIGTIFAMLRRRHPSETPALADVLRPGTDIVAAGYVLYGPSTIFVLSTGHGVHAFTLDPTVGEFFLSTPDIRCPARQRLFDQRGLPLALGTRSPEVERLDQIRRQRRRSSLRSAVRGLARRGRPSYPAQGRHLRVPGRLKEHRRQASSSLRSEPNGLLVRTSGRNGFHRKRTHSRSRSDQASRPHATRHRFG